MAQIYGIFIFLAFISVNYACQSGLKGVVHDMQKRHPQKCMQCPEITISTQCNYESMDKDLTCGQSHLDIYTYWNKKQMCAKMTVHCSARPPKTIDARIAIEEISKPTPSIPEPIINENATFSKIIDFQNDSNQTNSFTNEELGFVEEDGSGTEILIDESNDAGPTYISITKEEKFHAFSYLTCNDDGKWETTDSDGKKFEGIETVHCIVVKV